MGVGPRIRKEKAKETSPKGQKTKYPEEIAGKRLLGAMDGTLCFKLFVHDA